ncbi:hypothetical protein AGMMS50262_23670 [Bacteroidia bacterium]|nr:hypothetical protein AGMMS50262_23670 [Bacteroidia bacterium]
MHFIIAQEKLPENANHFLKESLNSPLLSEKMDYTVNKYDFSPIWLERNDALLGFIDGNNYQRLKIKFLSIVKNPTDSSKYFVYGKSMVKSNICSFLGEIKIISIGQIKTDKEEKQSLFMEYQDEGRRAKRFLSPEYLLLAEYSFYEDLKVKGSGKFEGILKTNFYVYEDKVHYNDLRMETSDLFNNNQYVGTWTSYSTNKSKICNWGEFRIPYAENLDIGVGEFQPNEIYLSFGWKSYLKSLENKNDKTTKQAVEEEKREWWK